MKHSFKILVAFISLFLLSQIFGLYILSLSVQNIIQTPDGVTVIYANTSIGERPDVQGYASLIYIGIGVLVGTVLLLLIAKYNKIKVWKVWFFLAAWMTMSISIGAFIPENNYWVSWIIAGILALIKIKYPHPVLHNLTELLMYAGIGLLLAPILLVPVAILLLIAISVYDAYAVWKSKHMITLAEFTKKAALFPGLSFTYSEKKDKTIIHSSHKSADKHSHQSHIVSEKNMAKHDSKNSKARTGVLGGGDVIFPLLFAGAVFTQLLSKGHNSISAMALSSIISLSAATALLLLFVYGKKDRYYPAMPFITAGCLVGYCIILLFV